MTILNVVQHEISAELLRDLVQCVQAARDGADSQSLFALQCDLVLARAAREVDGIVTPRTVQPPPLSFEVPSSTYAVHREFEHQ